MQEKKQDSSQVFCLDQVQLYSQDQCFPFTLVKSGFQRGSLPLKIMPVKYVKTHSYNHRTGNKYCTKMRFWRGKPAPGAYSILAVTYMQFKQSWGDSVVCLMGKGEGTSRNGAVFPARPPTATCQETLRLF